MYLYMYTVVPPLPAQPKLTYMCSHSKVLNRDCLFQLTQCSRGCSTNIYPL